MPSINPITVSRLKTFVLIGHSNAEGSAPYTNVVAANPDYRAIGTDLLTQQALLYWKNVFVATSAQPFPHASPGDTNEAIASDVGDVEWLELTVANPMRPTDPHPHASPYNYPNCRGGCYPRWFYDSFASNDFTFASGQYPSPNGLNDTPTNDWWNYDNALQDDTSLFSSVQFPNGVGTGLEIPFSWIWRNHWQDQVGMVKMAFGSSLFLPFEPGDSVDSWTDPRILGAPGRHYTSDFTPGYVRSSVDGTKSDFYAYWTPADCFDWAPQTGRFYKKWYDKMVGAAAALDAANPGAKIDVQIVIPWMGDNDANNKAQQTLENSWEEAVRAFIKRIRADLVANDWTSLPEHQIPIIWPEVHSGYPGPNDSPNFSSVDFCNEALRRIAADDPYMATVSPEDWMTNTESGDVIWSGNIHPPTNHIGSKGYPQAAEAIFEAWKAMQTEPFDALDLDETLTVEQSIDRVRTYYAKSRTNTDQTRSYVLQHLNAAMYHCLNHVGDNAWWLRRRKSIALTSGPTVVQTLPRYVHRLLRIEDPSDPTYPISFEQIGFGSGGKLQIHTDERASGTYVIHFIEMPKELVTDDQRVPAPKNITEWIIVETCKRMAAAAANVPLTAHFAGQAQQLQSDSLRNMAQMQRSKKDSMRTQRRPYRQNYRRSSNYRSWGSD